jgi:hypothetical protein
MRGIAGAGANQLAEILARQHGVVSRDQALACGLSPGALRHRLRPAGPWQVLIPGTYLAATGTITMDHRDMAALLHAGPRSIITGPAALRRSGLEPPARGIVDVLVPAGTRRASSGFVRVHRTHRMPDQVCVSGEIRFVLVPRAIGDTARALTELASVRALVASAVQRRRCTIQVLARELAEGPARGSTLLRTALAEVADGIRSAAEGDFLDLVKRARLPMPMFNARIYDGARLLAVVDSWWPQAGVAAEIDSRAWHLSPEDWQRTVARHTRLSERGIVVLHFTPQRLRSDRAAVAASIRSALATPARSPLPVRVLPATA